MVYYFFKKITMDELFFCFLNQEVLDKVYRKCILNTMSEQNNGKLNQLLTDLHDTTLVSSHWLQVHGYSRSLIVRYVTSGWLVSPARGVYLRKGGRLQWEGVVHSLQSGEALPLHVGGRFALVIQGHEHYLRLGEAGTVTLYGPARPPGWVGKLPLKERFECQGEGPFNFPALCFAPDISEKALLDHSLAWHEASQGAGAIVCSTPERAMLELCDGVSDPALVYEADALMQAMTTLRPQRVGMLLRHCHSIKAKRLFLALADRHRHAWLPHVPLDDVDLGRGKRALVSGGRLHPIYQITLPRDLDEHLG
ncbi:type IV toxin-antitoxin system AbiEi family antitoxin domain-containing protein [Acerihabitans sp.]|uniref:type IV toxin-antitoxin system AbiEi family antitoxin domain-containing protein n=1 Tax=Acerihabitans sp. TaxID=2811394 RepID=UPI002EDAABE5